MAPLTREWLLTAAGYFGWLAGMFIAGLATGMFNADAPWFFDAAHYHTIASSGYQKWLTAFFPGFPFLWKALGCVPWIGLVHAALVAFGLGGVAVSWNMTRVEKALLILAPLGGFWLLPYSEGLTVFALCAVLIGFRKMDARLAFLGMLVAAFSRPLWPLFLVALVFLALKPWQAGARKTVVIPAGLGLLCGTIAAWSVHALSVGEWFTFQSAQSLWGNSLRMPHVPFSTWSDEVVMMVDSSALMVSVIAGIWVIRWMLGTASLHGGAGALSALYLAGIGALTLAFRGGELFSLGRFVWALPFVPLLVIFELRKAGTARGVWWLLLVVPTVALLCGAYLHIRSVGVYGPLLGCAVAVMALIAKPCKEWIQWGFVLILAAVQWAVWYRMLSGEWVG